MDPRKKRTTTMVMPESARQKFKAKGWSHQSDLAAAIGQTIILHTDKEFLRGTLVAADQFTIKIGMDEGDVVVFKSALKSFTVDPKVIAAIEASNDGN